MKKVFSLIFVFISLALISEERANYDLLVDKEFSPLMGGEDLISIHKTLQSLEDWLIPQRSLPPETGFKKLSRWVELAFFWDPLNLIMTTVQHEVFGHGYRIRTLPKSHAKVEGYSIHLPYDYFGKGVAGETKLKLGNKATLSDLITIDIAGIEAEEILAKRLKLKWLVTNRLDAREASLYLYTQQGLLLYAISSPKNELKLTLMDNTDDESFFDNDLHSYVRSLNTAYPSDRISFKKVKHQSYFNLIDPFTLYAICSPWYYIFTGKQFRFPMIPLGGEVFYLPGYRVSLAPYGLEKNIDHFFKIKERPLYLYTKWGQHAGNHYWGGGIDYDQCFSWLGGRLGFRIDVWKQPRFYEPIQLTGLLQKNIAKNFPELSKKRYGGSASLIARWSLGEKSPMTLYTEMGYKSKGYLPGYPVNNGNIIRLGISSTF